MKWPLAPSPPLIWSQGLAPAHYQCSFHCITLKVSKWLWWEQVLVFWVIDQFSAIVYCLDTVIVHCSLCAFLIVIVGYYGGTCAFCGIWTAVTVSHMIHVHARITKNVKKLLMPSLFNYFQTCFRHEYILAAMSRSLDI